MIETSQCNDQSGHCLIVFTENTPRYAPYRGDQSEAVAIVGAPMNSVYFFYQGIGFVMHFRDTQSHGGPANQLATFIAIDAGWDNDNNYISGTAIIAIGSINEPDIDYPINFCTRQSDSLYKFMENMKDKYPELYWVGNIGE